jgi:peptidoglycan/LPS O-acetylase OafA/YrhL
MTHVPRIVLAVVCGYVLMAVIVVVANTAFGWLFTPQQRLAPTFVYMLAILTVGALAAVAGGWVAAVLARVRSHIAVYGLIALVVVLGLIDAVLPGTQQPVWYRLALIVIGASGVWIGGYLHQSKAHRRC